MISPQDIDRVIGNDVVDNDGDTIGTATEVFLDDQSGNPEWVTVKTGLFGTKSTFVPLREATLTDGGVRVPVSKAAVKDAPKVDADQHLSPQEEEELYRHYGVGEQMAGTGQMGDGLDDRGMRTGTGDARLGDDLDDRGQHAARSTEDGPAVTGTGMTDTAMAGTGTAMTGTDDAMTGTGTAGTTGMGADTTGRTGTVGHDTSGPTTDDAMTRSEERLSVGTESTEVGRARLRKYVVTENVTQTVPVSHEEVRIEREPITDANRGDALDGPALSEEEHEVTLRAERPVVDKETVPVERVRLDTETVTDQVTVDEQVAHEEIEQVEDTSRDSTR